MDITTKGAIQAERRKRAQEILENSAAKCNGLEIPEHLPTFLGVEHGSDNDPLWGYFGPSLAAIARDFEESDTDGIFRHRAYNLDTGKVFYPVFQVQRWVEVS